MICRYKEFHMDIGHTNISCTPTSSTDCRMCDHTSCKKSYDVQIPMSKNYGWVIVRLFKFDNSMWYEKSKFMDSDFAIKLIHPDLDPIWVVAFNDKKYKIVDKKKMVACDDVDRLNMELLLNFGFDSTCKRFSDTSFVWENLIDKYVNKTNKE